MEMYTTDLNMTKTKEIVKLIFAEMGEITKIVAAQKGMETADTQVNLGVAASYLGMLLASMTETIARTIVDGDEPDAEMHKFFGEVTSEYARYLNRHVTPGK